MKPQIMERAPDTYAVVDWHRSFVFGRTAPEPHDDGARHVQPLLRANMPILRGEHIEPFPKPAPPQPKGPKPQPPAPSPAPEPKPKVGQFHGGMVIRALAVLKRSILG